MTTEAARAARQRAARSSPSSTTTTTPRSPPPSSRACPRSRAGPSRRRPTRKARRARTSAARRRIAPADCCSGTGARVTIDRRKHLSPSAFKNVAPVGLRRGDRAGGPLPAGAIELPHFEAKYGGRVRPLWSPIWSLAEVFRDMVRRPCEYVHGGRRSDPRRAAQDVNADGGLDRPEIIGRLQDNRPAPPGAVKRPLRFPRYIGFLWRFYMGAQGA